MGLSPEQWRSLRDDEIPTRTIKLSTLRARVDRHFLPSLPESDFTKLAPLGGKSLAVYLVALQRSRIDRSNPVKLSTCYLSRFGISRREKARALGHLERAGLVKVEYRESRNPLVLLMNEKKRKNKR